MSVVIRSVTEPPSPCSFSVLTLNPLLQYEICPVFALTNLAADTNVLAREVLTDLAS